MTNREALADLRQSYGWPSERPRVTPTHWAEDAGGRHLITSIIKKRGIQVILEIGVFFGGSSRKWLDTSPDVTVVGLDRWTGNWWADYARERRRFDIVDQLEAEDGPYQTFLASMWDYQDRLIPVRGVSPEKIYELHARGLRPDLVYLDADKEGREIDICHELFPEAIITGDDWWWGNDRFVATDDVYPIRKPVRDFCEKHGRFLKTDGHTWVIDDEAPSLAYRVKRPLYQLKSVRRRVRGMIRSVGRDIGILSKSA